MSRPENKFSYSPTKTLTRLETTSGWDQAYHLESPFIILRTVIWQKGISSGERRRHRHPGWVKAETILHLKQKSITKEYATNQHSLMWANPPSAPNYNPFDLLQLLCHTIFSFLWDQFGRPKIKLIVVQGQKHQEERNDLFCELIWQNKLNNQLLRLWDFSLIKGYHQQLKIQQRKVPKACCLILSFEE